MPRTRALEEIVFDADHARRRAKDLLRAAKGGDRDALDRLTVRREVPRLADAQLSIAREAGFPSWAALLRREERFDLARYDEIGWSDVRRVSMVPFTHDGEVVLVGAGRRFVVPSATALRKEDPLVDTTLRVGLDGAGFRRQNTHVLATSKDRRHVVVWAEGARYAGQRPHRRDAAWWTGTPTHAAALLVERGDDALARLVEAAGVAARTISDDESMADMQRLVNAVYLAETTPQGGSGFHGSSEQWFETHKTIIDAVDADGTFLDVGCANGFLGECVERWCAERGTRIDAFGVDISSQLIELARSRIPDRADRFSVGDALSWTAPKGQRFDYVHTLLEHVPPHRCAEMISHLLDHVVADGGRLIVGQYLGTEPERRPDRWLERLGFSVDGLTAEPVPRAWIDKRPKPKDA